MDLSTVALVMNVTGIFSNITTVSIPVEGLNETTLEDGFTGSTSVHGMTGSSAMFSTLISNFTGTTTSMDFPITTVATSFAPNSTNASKIIKMCKIKTDNPIYVAKMNDYIYTHMYIPAITLTSVLFIIGLPGNLIVFYVYLRRWRKTTSRVFILALAGFDLVNCLCTPIEIAMLANIIKFDYPIMCKFSRFLTFAMNNCSSFTLVVISIDRFRRICFPLKPQITNIQAKIWILVSVIAAIAASWPAAVFYGTTTIPIPSSIPGVCIIGKTCLIEDAYATSPYPLYFGIVLLAGTLLIDLVLIISYSCIAYKVLQRGVFDDKCKCRKDSMVSASTDNDMLDDESANNSPIVKRQLSYNLSVEAASKVKNNSTDGNKEETTPLKTRTESETGNTASSVKKGSTKRRPSENSSFGGSMKAFLSRKGSESGSGGGSVRSKSFSRSTSLADRRKQFQKQRSMSSQSIESRKNQMYKTTLMLFSVTLLFIISFVPYCVIAIMRYTNPVYYYTLSNRGKAVFQFFLRTYLLSSSLNPVIYSFLSVQFRDECKAVLFGILAKCGCRCGSFSRSPTVHSH